MITLPIDFIKKYTALLGKEAPDFFNALQTDSDKSFRVNPLKHHVSLTNFINFPLLSTPFSPHGYFGKVGGNTPLHQSGYIYSQEASAMIVASVANVSPGELVLDLCAAPGGKSTQLAGQLGDSGLLVSNEIVPKRAKILSENLERWGTTQVIVTNHSPESLVSCFSGFFDKVIVDAPCSGEGMFKRDDVAINEWSIDSCDYCAKRQKDILSSAISLLKSGGQLIYSTCTFSPEENEEIISWLVTEYPMQILPIDLFDNDTVSHGRQSWGYVPHLERTIRLWPHLTAGDGHFVAKLQFNGMNAITSRPKSKKETVYDLSKEQQKLFATWQTHFPIPLTGKLQVFGNQLWAVPIESPSLEGIKWLRNGLHIGTFLKNRFEPSFALAMSIKSYDTLPHIELSYADWKKYVNGETFETSSQLTGWVLLCYQGLIVGFGKNTHGTVKNFYPKGLRFKVRD